MKPLSMAGAAQAIALTVAMASPALAQQGAPAGSQEPKPVAQLESVEGSVLVSNPTGLSAGGKGTRLTTGTRVITPANGKALVQFDNGCSVRLEPNQRLVIDPDKSCEELLLLVQSTLPAPPLPPSPSLSGMALAGGLPDLTGSLLLGIAGVTSVIRYRRDDNVSPN